MEYAGLPQTVEVTETPVTNVNNKETPQVLFFAGDAISDREKRELKFKEFGGVHLPHLRTLREQKGMLYRCQLTRLNKSAMDMQWSRMLSPGWEQGERFKRSFVQSKNINGELKQRVVDGFIESDPNASRQGEFVPVKSDHIVYGKRYAGDEATEATKINPPHGPAGIVKIEALEGASAAEVNEAQLYFFPNWNEIRSGIDTLPKTIPDLIKHLEERRSEIKNEMWDDEKKAKYHSIGQSMLTSCREFMRTARDTVRSDERIFENIGKLDERIAHSPMSDHLMEQTGVTRQKDVLANEQGAMRELVTEMRSEREIKAEREAKMLEIEERKLFLEEVKAGIRNPDGSLIADAVKHIATEVFDSDGIEHSLTDDQIAEATMDLLETDEASVTLANPENYSIGQTIETSRGSAEVIGKPFGRTKVRFEDGEEMMLDKLD